MDLPGIIQIIVSIVTLGVAAWAVYLSWQTGKVMKEMEGHLEAHSNLLAGTQVLLSSLGVTIDILRTINPLGSSADGKLVGPTFQEAVRNTLAELSKAVLSKPK